MNTKNFLFSAVAGTVVYFLLGWLLYGFLFKDFFPQQEEMSHGMFFIFLGCLFYASFVAFIFNKWASISQWMTGAKAGAVIGFFVAVSMNFFMFAGKTVDYQAMALDVILTMIMSAVTGAVIAFVVGKMNA